MSRRTSGRLRMILLAVTAAVLSTCGILLDPSDYVPYQGRNVVVFRQAGTGEEKYRTLADLADGAWLEVRETTGIIVEEKPRIIVTNEDSGRMATLSSDLYSVDGTVHLSEEALSYKREVLENILRHELTHSIVYLFYGHTDSFVLAEGVAEYVEYSGRIPSIVPAYERRRLQPAFGYTSADVYRDVKTGESPEEAKNRITELYRLAGTFVSYWIDRYGMKAFFQLYREFRCDLVARSFFSATGIPFEDMYADFSRY